MPSYVVSGFRACEKLVRLSRLIEVATRSKSYYPARMSDDTDPRLPEFPPPTRGPQDPAETAPRYETANRIQIELTPTDLDAMLPPGHMARLVWRFVEGLDLAAFYATIRAREGGPGRSPIDPKILMALWLYATIDGVGSARALDRLCYSHDAYRWIRGGVSVNHHTLSDFRIDHHAALDDLLTQSITTLRHRGMVTLARVAQDGTRVRASAGVGSFRREGTLRECLKEAQKLVERTTRQGDGGLTRAEAAQARAAADRLARVEEALAELPAVAAAKARTARKRKGREPKEARASTTDPEARVMKMADGGYRPAYNVQFATDHDSDVIVGVAVTNASDQHELVPMLTQVETRVDRPDTLLVDGGFVSHAAIDEVTARGVTVVAPVPRRQGTDDPVPVQPTDSPAVAAWRTRMQTEEAKQQYRSRGAIAERINADAHTHRTLRRILVRGLPKVLACVLWVALAHNLTRSMDLVPHLMT
jgi:transposase